MKRGLLLGKFAPLTQGHVTCIIRAASRVDELYVVLCYDEKFQRTLPPELMHRMSLANRYRWLQETFADYPAINICVVDESAIASYPDGMTEFTELARTALKTTFGQEVIITHTFSSEPDYEMYFSRHFPSATHELIDPDRRLVPISATIVRNDLYKNWDFVTPAAQRDLIKRVAIIGCESTGKSTLAKELRDYFATSYVEEVGRTICERDFFSHEEYMGVEDYEQIAFAHKIAEQETAQTARKVVISDTTNLITEFSAYLMGHESALLRELSRREMYDLVLYLDIDVPWVGDNLRRNGDHSRRVHTDAVLRKFCNDRSVENIVHVGGTYEERFLQSVTLISQLLGEAQ